MGSFLNYLEKMPEMDKKVKTVQKRNVQEEYQPKKQKVLALNVEVRSVEGAQLVIEKLQQWIAKIESENQIKKPFRIKPKRIIKEDLRQQRKPKNVSESTNRACDILDGLPDEPEQVLEPLIQQSNHINIVQSQRPQLNLETVAGHASALL